MKIHNMLLILSLTSIVGCSTIGDIEMLNDINGGSDIRETFHVINKTMNVIGQSPTHDNHNKVNNINVLYGNVRHDNYQVRSMSDVPYVIRNMQDANLYVNAILKRNK